MPDPRDEVILQVNGQNFGGWQSVEITRSIEAISGSFSITYSDRWTPDQDAWDIERGDKCVVLLGKDVVITGHVDTVNSSFSAENSTLQVTGRDNTADLVDCSDDISIAQLKNVNALAIANIMASRFGIAVSSDVSVGKAFEVFTLQPGETAFSTILNACRKRSLMPVATRNGGLLLTQAGKSRSAGALIEGMNIISANANHSMQGRYSEIIVKAQSQGTEGWSGEKSAQMIAKARDVGVPRFRPLVLIQGGDNDVEELQRRANWESSTRAGQGLVGSITVPGWRQAGGGIWKENEIVPVKSPTLKIEKDMLIKSVNYSISEGGQITRIGITRKDAYLPEPPEPENDATTREPSFIEGIVESLQFDVGSS